MFKALFANLTEKEKNEAIEGIVVRATPRQDFFLMITLSIAMATFGVLLASTVIMIGSMLIAPLLYPLLSLALGVIASDTKLIARSLKTVLRSVLLALVAGTVIGLLFAPRGAEIIFPIGIEAGTASSLMYALVAVIAGLAAAFAMTKPWLNETLPGVAIAVALVPPLAVMGIGLSLFNWSVFTNSLLLFLVNVIGILFSAMIVFSLMRFAVKQKVTKDVVKEEEKIIEKEIAFKTEGK